ncbi:stalk domain-containing protein [Paenibacillus chibensis]|uniref:stalk domain-containing protein n=1 Tax=Paenibacillus chibensis TaxID=59846 RepID=UPI001FEAF6FE|nr:stalk domain-containing protein [Paenibacillus chibensis]MEC0368768.1 stalk domain-containing protein [Paenibacillus chibensis]
MKKKWIIFGTTAALMLTAGTGVYAGTQLQEIKAYLNGNIQLKYNGMPVQARDEKGNAVLPITYNGTTYLPVRAVADVMGVAVSYDSKTSTVELGEKAEGVAIAKGFDSMYYTKDPAQTTYQGKDYKEAYFDNAGSARSSSFMLFPKGKYQKLYLQVAAVGENIDNFFVEDSDKNVKLKTESIAVKDGLKTIEVDIAGVSELFVYADVKKSGAMFVPLTTSYYK